VRPPRRGDAQDFLFSVPTICDEIPPALLSASHVESDVYQLHEDDWRQVEFVSIAQMSTVELNLVEIRKVRQQQVGAGFRASMFARSPDICSRESS
jgi:hypothetical protein